MTSEEFLAGGLRERVVRKADGSGYESSLHSAQQEQQHQQQQQQQQQEQEGRNGVSGGRLEEREHQLKTQGRTPNGTRR